MAKLTVNVDGGARGNPGPAAIGVVVRDGDGEMLKEVGEESAARPTTSPSTGRCLRGIELAAEHGAGELELVGDSELVVRQVEGRYKVKDATMKELHGEVKRALADFGGWSIRHVRRAQNADADRLVNEALDG